MSQHDYNIANGGGAAVRADMNLALAAIQSQNSGLTEPVVTKPFMPWFDTTTGILKMRNAADTGWINVVQLANAQTFTAAQRGAVAALTDGATITPDFAAGNNFSVTLGGNRTMANPTNLVAGQSGIIVITQDATGSRTLAFGSYWKFATGTAPTLTTTAAAVDVLAYYVESSTRITTRLIGDVK